MGHPRGVVGGHLWLLPDSLQKGRLAALRLGRLPGLRDPQSAVECRLVLAADESQVKVGQGHDLLIVCDLHPLTCDKREGLVILERSNVEQFEQSTGLFEGNPRFPIERCRAIVSVRNVPPALGNPRCVQPSTPSLQASR